MRKVSLPLHTEWLDELPGVEKPGTARQMLHKLCSLDDAPYQGEAPEAKYFDAALVHARLTDAGKALVPNLAGPSRAFIKPLIAFLHKQSSAEADILREALVASKPLLSPHQREHAPDFSAAVPSAAPAKKSAEEQSVAERSRASVCIDAH